MPELEAEFKRRFVEAKPGVYVDRREIARMSFPDCEELARMPGRPPTRYTRDEAFVVLDTRA